MHFGGGPNIYFEVVDRVSFELTVHDRYHCWFSLVSDERFLWFYVTNDLAVKSHIRLQLCMNFMLIQYYAWIMVSFEFRSENEYVINISTAATESEKSTFWMAWFKSSRRRFFIYLLIRCREGNNFMNKLQNINKFFERMQKYFRIHEKERERVEDRSR